MNRLPYLNEILKNRTDECLILGVKSGGSMILAKNRDRMYKPIMKMYREYHSDNDLELVYVKDEETGWMEGMNSVGIGIINTALLVEHDEKELEKVKKTRKKLKDGKKIRRALTFDKIENAIDSLINYRNGIKGHTIISDNEKMFILEISSDHGITIKERNVDKPLIRANHGFFQPSAGYTDGKDYLSSVLRRSQIMDNLEELDDKDGNVDMFEIMSTSKYGKSNPNNIVRDTKTMNTTSQYYMDLGKLSFNFKPINGKIEFLGVEEINLPDDYEPRISINIVE